MKKLSKTNVLILLFGMIPSLSAGSPVVISDVPAYNWYHGCGPTAAASIIGYWDLHGYPNLFTASRTDVFLTENVKDQISSPEHNASSNPYAVTSMTSIADWFRTWPDGTSYLNEAAPTFIGYANYRGYAFNSRTEGFGEYWWHDLTFTWNDVMSEINSGYPMMLTVDSNGDGSADHFVPVLGYDDRGGDGLWYGLYTTWSESEDIAWEPLREISKGHPWGVGYGTFVHPLPDPVPEPSTILLLASGLIGLLAFKMLKN